MFRLTSHLQARTVFVCKVTVLVLGSQTFTFTRKRLEFQNEHSDFANKYSSSLKMTHVNRNM